MTRQRGFKSLWLSEAASFYPFGTIFIRPTGIPNWQQLEKPFPARFLSGHFAFGPNKWAKEVRHDPNIFFSGEEINLSVRSYTHGYDMFHPHRVIIWHATMKRKRERVNWCGMTNIKEVKINGGHNRTLQEQESVNYLVFEDNGFNLEPYGLGTKRTVRDYEKYAGIHFKIKSHSKNGLLITNSLQTHIIMRLRRSGENSFTYSFYHLVNIERYELPADDYTSILVAFDDEDGVGMYSTSVEGNDLQRFLNGDGPIHYEQMFMTDKKPTRVVYWGHSDKRGWAERVERIID